MKYLFYVHREIASWRMVCRDDRGFPKDTTEDEWQFTRARDAADTNPDVRNEVDAQGYSLFKLGGSFADIAADRARLRSDSRR
jgi:hypothetical protein